MYRSAQARPATRPRRPPARPPPSLSSSCCAQHRKSSKGTRLDAENTASETHFAVARPLGTAWLDASIRHLYRTSAPRFLYQTLAERSPHRQDPQERLLRLSGLFEEWNVRGSNP